MEMHVGAHGPPDGDAVEPSAYAGAPLHREAEPPVGHRLEMRIMELVAADRLARQEEVVRRSGGAYVGWSVPLVRQHRSGREYAGHGVLFAVSADG